MNKINKICSFSFAGLLIVLQGCSQSFIQDDWLCPLVQGKGCLSIEEADTGVQKQPTASLSETPSKTAQPVSQLPAAPKAASNSATSAAPPLPPVVGGGGGSPAPLAAAKLRDPEKLARIWIAPFIDAQDILHEGGFVHVVIEPARWRSQDQEPGQ